MPHPRGAHALWSVPQRKKMGGVNAAKENQRMIGKQIRILENRLDKVRVAPPVPPSPLARGCCLRHVTTALPGPCQV